MRCCRMSTVRLVDGDLPYQGRLEVYHNGEWGTVCDDDFENVDATVACRSINSGSVYLGISCWKLDLVSSLRHWRRLAWARGPSQMCRLAPLQWNILLKNQEVNYVKLKILVVSAVKICTRASALDHTGDLHPQSSGLQPKIKIPGDANGHRA